MLDQGSDNGRKLKIIQFRIRYSSNKQILNPDDFLNSMNTVEALRIEQRRITELQICTKPQYQRQVLC